MSKKAAFIMTNGLWRPNIDVTDRKDDDDDGPSRPLTHAWPPSLPQFPLSSLTFVLLSHKLPVSPGHSSSALTANI